MKKAFPGILLACALTLGQTVPEIAEKGIRYFQNSRYKLAEKQFELALQKSIVSGRPDWIASSLLNLLALQFDAGRTEKAGELLHSFPPAEKGSEMAALLDWKWAQYYQLAGREDSAAFYYRRAVEQCGAANRCPEIQLDQIHFALASENYVTAEKERWWGRIAALEKEKRLQNSGEIFALRGLWFLRSREYAKGAEAWKQAVARFKEDKYYSRMAKSLKYLAMTYIKLGRNAEAEAAVDRSLVVYEILDLPGPAYQVALLKLFILKDAKDIENYKRNLDFFGESPADRNWEQTFREIKQIANISPSPLLTSLFP